ncbi:PREDICTED: uncharacterized protein LOC101306804 [Fragaria vesca subsp. vesca]|uniref:uncharacterized protein LOC101306804 n=1 Tax=Fragaria vesca subsp. vesca TaxID=101020 RepID=UPI0002C2DDAA|nr:PREDICTED: uncharacterized protein LOC101306804 [Fragaria vesca subsp. vesca]
MGRSSSGKGKKVEEPPAPAEPPVILRWQDLPEDDPARDMIVIAPEDYMPSLGKGKGKGKGKRNEKETEKPKVQGKRKKAEGPPLANYIKIGDLALACKMCPNPDWHPTFQCPNLTPGLKERLKEARLRGGTFRAFHPDDHMYCHVCLSKDHWSSQCKYRIELPAHAKVGPLAEIHCLCCGEVSPHPGEPGVDWKARAVLKASCMLGDPNMLKRADAAGGTKASTSAGASNGTVVKASA